ncbi:MAG: hypothetical protein R3F60_29875 [bacterium]
MRGSVGLPVVVLLAVQAAGALGLPFLWTSTFGPGATSAPGAALAPAYLALGAYAVAGGASAGWLAAAVTRTPGWLAVLLWVGLALPAAFAACFVACLLLACAGVF